MKNMKKSKVIISVIVVLAILMMAFMIFTSNAAGAKDPGQIKAVDTDTGKMEEIGGKVITIISVVGSIASVIVLVVLGLKYMMGSAEEKAEYKKTLMPYVIGAGLVFAASAIAGAIYGFVHGF